MKTMKALDRLLEWVDRKIFPHHYAFLQQYDASMQLGRAWDYLFHDRWSLASTCARGRLLPEESEALEILRCLAYKSLEKMA